jgi:hypothetical protein
MDTSTHTDISITRRYVEANPPAFGSVEQIAGVLRMNNPSRTLVEGRALAIINVLAEDAEPDAVRLGYVRNALAAVELVRAELAADR